MNRRAFTLLEVLAATMILSLLVLSALPLARHLARGEPGLADARTARAFLQSNARFARVNAQPAPVAGHPGWWVSCTALSGTVVSADEGIQTMPGQPREWLQLQLRDGPDLSATVLAEVLVVRPVSVKKP